MSYSRWSTSTWYTFWSASSPNGLFDKDEQVFEICDAPESYYVTYKRIKHDPDVVIEDVRWFFSQDRPGKIFDGVDPETKKFVYVDWVYPAKNPTDEELEELKGYMLEFVKDMDEHFRPLTWFKFEVWYPVRNRVFRWWNKQRKKGVDQSI
jgi:hypothetical protein